MADYRYHCSNCGKTYIGPASPGMMCTCAPPKQMIGSPYVTQAAPLSPELLAVLNIDAATKRRTELCAAWGVKNKSHSSHGSNFSGNQTLAQLINNIVEPVQGSAERGRVKALIIEQFQYDIDTQQMA
jgi:hypothetical protein